MPAGSVRVARPGSGLLVPFDVPELTISEAISRNWRRREDGRLMEPKPEEFLQTSPLHIRIVPNWMSSWGWW